MIRWSQLASSMGITLWWGCWMVHPQGTSNWSIHVNPLEDGPEPVFYEDQAEPLSSQDLISGIPECHVSHSLDQANC